MRFSCGAPVAAARLPSYFPGRQRGQGGSKMKIGVRSAAMLVMLVFALFCARQAVAASVSASTVEVGGVSAALLKPAHSHGAIILLAGGDGNIGVGPDGSIARQGNQLVRTRMAYAERGFVVLVPDCCVDVAAAVSYMGQFG